MRVPLLGLPGTPLTISSEKEKEKGKEKNFRKGKRSRRKAFGKKVWVQCNYSFSFFTCKKGCCVFVTYIEILILFLICFCIDFVIDF